MIKKKFKTSKNNNNNSIFVKKTHNEIKTEKKGKNKIKKTLSISIGNKTTKNDCNINDNSIYNKITPEKSKNLSFANTISTNKKKDKNFVINQKNILENTFSYRNKKYIKYFNTIQNTQPSTKKNFLKTNYKTKKEEKTKEKENEKEENDRMININNNYDFNLYHNLEENIKKENELCYDEICKNSIYCLDCILSSCPNCPTFSKHENHNYIYTYNYYFDYKTQLEECFNDIDCLFSLNPFYLDVNKIKGELKIQVNNQINQLIDKLNEIKNDKLTEIDQLIDINDNNIELLKEKKVKIKNNIISLLDDSKNFLNFQNNRNENSDNINNDFYNTSFLIRYDLLKHTEFINDEIKAIIMDIKRNSQKYIDEFNNIINAVKNDISNLSESFNGQFKYKELNYELYKPIEEKIIMYNDKIELLKKQIFDIINKKGGLEKIEYSNKISNESYKKKYFNILDFEVNNTNEISKINKINDDGKGMLRHKTTDFKTKKFNLEDNNKDISQNSKVSEIFKSVKDVCLNTKILQNYYSYEILKMISNSNQFSDKNISSKSSHKPLNNNINNINNEEYKIQAMPGTNEIQIFDKKTGIITKKFIKLNFKYSYFLNGCRSIQIKDLLYITGGVSKEKKETKIALVYSVKTNEISLLPEMLKPHSYHSIYYIDSYNSILVIGGENNNCCEMFNINTNTWSNLPDMNYAKSNCNIFFDNSKDYIYTLFGKFGKITDIFL
jgi:hypothetical protein